HQWSRAPSATTEGTATAADAQGEQPSGRRAQPQPGIERRFVALLAADREDVGDHLRALMGLLRQHEVPVNWLELLRDLGNWDSADRDVQRRWARSFWGSSVVDQQPA